jgi:Abnormal spindle-like microcephaly-assoc'd, ASPM-SPD-2-Hydin/Beta-propeller repeat
VTYKSLRPSVLTAAVLIYISLMPTQGQKAPQPSAASALSAANQQKVEAIYAGLPLLFEKNEGQTNPEVNFLSRTPAYTLFLTGQEAIIRNNYGKKNNIPLRMQWVGAQGNVTGSGEREIAGKSNYFIGNDASQWHTKIANYERVKYSGVYPGVDLVYYGNHEKIEYDLVVSPGADPNAIHLRFAGASKLRIDKQSGDLLVRNRGGEVRFHKPDVYQQDGAAQQTIAGAYVLSTRNTVSFALGDYDHSRQLVIDPYIAYSTVFGGSVSGGSLASNLLYGMAVDSSGDVYLQGLTNFTNLPTTSGAFQPACNAISATQCSNFFVAKFNPNLSGAASLIYATYLGGTESKIGGGQQSSVSSQANSLAVDSSGDAYITGYSSTYNYPTTSNAYSTTCGWSGSTSCYGGVLSKLNPSGSALLYSTYFPTSTAGGNLGATQPFMIAIDSSQVAYIAGTASYGLITTDGSAGGSSSPFIAAFDTTKSGTASLVYSQYLSLNYPPDIVAIAADPSGNAYLIGVLWPANNPAPGLTSVPIVLNGFQTTTGNTAGIGPVLLRLNHAGAITYASYVGSSAGGGDQLTAISVDATGNAYVGGRISSPAPVMNGLTATSGITAGAYIAKVNTNVTGTASLLYATFVTANANNASYITAVANNSNGLVGFVGTEISTTANISTIEVNPLTQPAGGSYLQFAGILDTTMTGDSALTFLSNVDGVQGLTAVSFDPSDANNLIIGGSADIGAINDPFLSVPASFATTEGNTNFPPFFYKISLLSPSGITVSPSALTFGNQVLTTTSASQPVTITNTGTTTITSIGIAVSTQFGETNTCDSLAASASCTVNVTFTPTATGTQTGTLTLTDSDPSSPQTVSLSGTGIAGTPQAVLNPATVPFGNQTVSTTSSAQVVVLSNPGTAALAITGVTLTGANPGDFADTSACGTSLVAGSSCNISVNFTPASATTFSASLSVADNATGSPQTASLTGTGIASSTPQAVLSPTTLSFPSTTVNSTSAAMSTTLSNPGTAALNITSVTLGGANTADFAITNGCGSTLAAGSSCQISATFTPVSVGSFSATITVSDNASGASQTVMLSGTGTAVTTASAPIASLSPAAITFPGTNIGSTAGAIPVTLSNTGNAALTITGVTIGGANASAFAETSACGTSLPAGASCLISVTFTAVAATTDTATLSVADNAPGSPQTVTLTCTGLSTGTNPADFTIAAPSPAQTVDPGGVAQFPLNITTILGNFNTPVVLSVTGLPAGATASFSPASVTPGTTGAPSTLSVQTGLTGALTVPRRPFNSDGHSQWFAALLLIPLLRVRRLRMKFGSLSIAARALLLGALALGSIASITGCSGGYFGSAAKTVTLTVTGTSGSLQHSTTVNLTIQ